MTDLVDVDLYSPDTYVESPPHAAFEQLRADDPVHWQPMPDGTGYWAVLRHADVTNVARHPKVFSAELGGVVLEDLDPDVARDDARHAPGHGSATPPRPPSQRRAPLHAGRHR